MPSPMKSSHANFLVGALIFLLMNCSAPESVPLDPSRPQHIAFILQYHFRGVHLQQLRVTAILPPNIPGRQQILTREYSMEPNMIRLKSGDSAGLFYYVKPLGDSVLLEIRGTALLTPVAATGKPAELAHMQQIQTQVGERLHYVLQGEDLPLDVAIEKGEGDCSEFAALGARLCAEHGFQARTVSGLHWRSGMPPFHSWMECSLPGKTWYPLDPTWAAEEIPSGNSPTDSLTRVGLERLRALQGTSWHFTVSQNESTLNPRRWVSYQYSGDSLTMRVTAEIKLLGK